MFAASACWAATCKRGRGHGRCMHVRVRGSAHVANHARMGMLGVLDGLPCVRITAPHRGLQRRRPVFDCINAAAADEFSED